MGTLVQTTAGPSATQPLLPKAALFPGDVLLSCGAGALSEMIRRLDGGLYSHAGVWDGECAVDATASGVKRNTLEYDEGEQVFIDAYRWHAALPNADPDLGGAGYPSKPVLDQAAKIVQQGAAFAYDELLLAALVIWLSNRPADKWLRMAARLLFSRFQVWFHERVTKPGKQSMVCSEVVARSFDQAVTPPDYSIKVIVDGSRDPAAIAAAIKAQGGISADFIRPLPPAPASSYDALKRRYGELLVSGMTGPERQHLLRFAAANLTTDSSSVLLMPAGHKDLPPNCVTPHDLQRSPNLRYLGRLSDKPAPNLPSSTFKLLMLVLKDYLKDKVKRASKR